MPSQNFLPIERNVLLDAFDGRDRAPAAPHLVRSARARGTVPFERGCGRIHILDRRRAEAARRACRARVRRPFDSVTGAVAAPGGAILAAGSSRKAEATRHGARGAAR